jgi:Putative zinc-finger
MNCEQAGHLLESYAEDELSQHDRHLLERHLANCTQCARQVGTRPVFECEVRRALGASAGTLYLSAGATSRIVQAAEESLQGAIRSRRALFGLRWVGGTLAVALLLVGLFALMGRIPVPLRLGTIVLSPANRLVLFHPQADTLPTEVTSAPQSAMAGNSSLPHASLLIEPRDMQPGEPFIMSISLLSESSQPIKAVRLDLEVDGPTGFYRFDLSMNGLLPAHGMSVLEVTPELLAKPCEEQYLISPTDIFRLPGVYTVRVILSDVGVASQ